MPIDYKTVIPHYKPLTQRKEMMLRQLSTFRFSNYSFYEKFDGDELDAETIKMFCVRKQYDINTVLRKISPWKIGIETQKELSKGEISLCIKYGHIFKEFLESNDPYLMILEDDVILCEDFDIKFQEYLERTPSDWDVIYFGSGGGLKPSNIVFGKTSYKMNHPASRCTDSIFFKRKTVDDIYKTWFPIHLSADWELGYQHFLHNHVIYWWEPGLVIQGSQCGVYKSSLQ